MNRPPRMECPRCGRKHGEWADDSPIWTCFGCGDEWVFSVEVSDQLRADWDAVWKEFKAVKQRLQNVSRRMDRAMTINIEATDRTGRVIARREYTQIGGHYVRASHRNDLRHVPAGGQENERVHGQ